MNYIIPFHCEASNYWQGLEIYESVQQGDSNSYLASKGFSSIDAKEIHGIKYEESILAYPVFQFQPHHHFNIDFIVVGFQTINLKSKKPKKNYGARSFGMIGNFLNPSKIYISEGMATALSVHRATNNPVVIALDVEGLKPVYNQISTIYPQAKIIIAADNDHLKSKNIGLLTASKICNYTYPIFSKENTGTDWNDFEKQFGTLETTKSIIANEHNPIL